MTNKEYTVLLADLITFMESYHLENIKLPQFKMNVTLDEYINWSVRTPFIIQIESNVPNDVAHEILKVNDFVLCYIDEHFPTHNPNEEWEHLTHLNKKWNFQKTYEVLCDGCANGFEFLISDGNLYMRERQ